MESGTKSALSTFKMLVQVVWIGLILVCVYLDRPPLGVTDSIPVALVPSTGGVLGPGRDDCSPGCG